MDDLTGEPLPCRVYLQDKAGASLMVTPGEPGATALPYREQWVPMPGVTEQHTTVSAHSFRAELKPGDYTIEIERGKEYLPLQESFTMREQPCQRTFRLKRWINLASLGWYSGETHVHRRIVELTNVMQAEDLNIAFPVTFWTVRSDRPPDLAPSPLRSQGPSPFGSREDRGAAPIWIEKNRVILPRNTEYEVFSVGAKRHTLGAMFLLNHRTVFTQTAPPVAAVAAQAHAEGALVDLDKHSWPWSMMLVPVAKVDLFELSNNSVWRTRFGFNALPAGLPAWMNLEKDSPNTLTEWGWLKYGFEAYYALLNCGFRISPSAGTASGVHPVPLGYSRVYVHLGDEFTPERWIAGLKASRSFVTTGPMLFAKVNGKLPGEAFESQNEEPQTIQLEIETASEKPLSEIEIVINGRVNERVVPSATRSDAGAWQSHLQRRVKIIDSSWLAVRCVEPQPDGRKRFAHTGPWHVTLAGRPVTPRREQALWLVELVEREIERNRPVLAPDALAEYEQALRVYRGILEGSRP
ncbi:MAG: CehA/McbA family metallohydrolase [Verrucomicrobiales bacterium]|nr:CehA/McbA family metallohydrolase [Verrucomicrobiales bacterium]